MPDTACWAQRKNSNSCDSAYCGYQSHRANRTGAGNCGADALGGGHLVQVSSGAGQAAFPGLSLYCATKLGHRGFLRLASAGGRRLGIQTTLVEPGTIRTDFGTSGALSPELDAYREGPVGMPCKIATGGYPAPGDPAKMAKAIVETFEAEVAPLRVALGQDVFGYIKAALTSRLDQIEAYKNLTTVSILPICTMYRHTCSANFSSAILTQRN